MTNGITGRPNRHSNPSHASKLKRGNRRFIRKKRHETKEMMKAVLR